MPRSVTELLDEDLHAGGQSGQVLGRLLSSSGAAWLAISPIEAHHNSTS